jgi:DNA-binding PadR family transcriptional regulator
MGLRLKRVGNVVRGPEKRKPYYPLLGALQAMILKKMDELGGDVAVSEVHEELILETGEWIEPSLIYSNIKKMADKYLKFVEPAGMGPSRGAGPPMKLYRVTAAGRAAIADTAAYHRAVADRLER